MGAFKAGLASLVQPLIVTSIPTIAYAAYTRSMPPEVLRFSIISVALLHVYDRMIHPHGVQTENMPMARLNRRIW